MRLYDTTLPHRSIIHEVWDLVDADITSYPLRKVVRRINAALEECVAWIINSDGTWQYDDTNYTDSPVGAGTLVEGQEAYAFSSEYLQIEQIEILDNGSPNVYQKIKPLDKAELRDLSTEQYFGVTSGGNPQTGFPEYFDQVGDTIRLYPAPSANSGVTLANGLRVYFKRTANLWTMSDSTTITSGEESREPGLPSTCHIMLAYMAALPYAAQYKKDLVSWLEKKIGDTPRPTGFKKKLLDHFAHREKAKRHVMRHKKILYI